MPILGLDSDKSNERGEPVFVPIPETGGGAHTHPITDIVGLAAAIAALAPIASPAFTGNPTAPTPALGDADTSIATTGFVMAAIAALLDSAPATLDTLNELAAALGDDPNFATTVMNAVAAKANVVHTHTIADTTGLQAALDAKAPLVSPTFTGNPTAPTPAPGGDDTSIATTAFVTAAIAAGGGGGGPLLGIVPKIGQFQVPVINVASWSTSTDALSFGASAAGSPIFVRKQITIDALSFNVVTAEAVSVRVALYSADDDGHPLSLVATGTGSGGSTGGVLVTLASPVVLPAGMYWAVVRSDGGTTIRFSAASGSSFAFPVSGINTNVGVPSRNIGIGIVMGGTFAAPNTTPTYAYGAISANDMPYVGLRRSA